MVNVLIVGSGSIGNHLAYACREQKWVVTIHDTDQKALDRTRNSIYPDRYGKWDESIQLVTVIDFKNEYDIVIIGTPPDTHISIANNIMDNFAPKILFIEKPLSTPNLDYSESFLAKISKSSTVCLVGYNHNLTLNTVRVEQLLDGGALGDAQYINIRWQEHWGGIYAAHPWLTGPEDSYLGYSNRGGGALCEHSHGISLWQHFSNVLNMGEIQYVNASLDMQHKGVCEYDQIAQISFRSEKGLIGSVAQDVVTNPSEKMMRIQGTKGYVEWYANYDKSNDAIKYKFNDGDEILELFPKTRPDDFRPEIQHLSEIIKNPGLLSPLRIEIGFRTMQIIANAFDSHRNNTTVKMK